MRPRFFRRSSPVVRARRAFTLVEVVVAILLVEIGLLALTASTGIVIRQTLLVRARVAALEMARNRVETLAAGPCADFRAGRIAAPTADSTHQLGNG